MLTDPLRLDVLLSESTIADRFKEALGHRLLPESFFYWFPLSIRAWLQLCQDGLYRNYSRSDTLLQQNAATVVAGLDGEYVEVISLGAGQGTKDLHLLSSLVHDGRRVMYRPVDSSQMLLEMACEHARQSSVSVHGLKADLSNPSHLTSLVPSTGTARRLVMLIGNTLGAFDPPAMLRGLRLLLRTDDLLLIDGELGGDETTRAGYEHPANRDFALAPLRSIGLTEADGTLIFELSTNEISGMHRLEKYFLFGEDRIVHIAGEELRFQAGERLRMNHSGKWRHGTLQSMVARAGFDVRDEYFSDDGRFLMIVATPAR